MRRSALFFVLLILAAIHGPAWGQKTHSPGFTIEIDKRLPATLDGVTRHFEMATVRRADLTGALPVAVLLHGKPFTEPEARAYHVEDYLGQARDLAARGYLVLIVMRSGFGDTDSSVPRIRHTIEGFTDYARSGAGDVRAVLSLVLASGKGRLPLVLVSHSAGGFVASELAAEFGVQVKAVIEISAGLDTPDDTKPIQEDFFRGTARRQSAPTAFLYEVHDTTIVPELEARITRAYYAGGGRGVFRQLDDARAGGHNVFSTYQGRIWWLGQADEFLNQLSLPAIAPAQEERLYAALSMPDMRKVVHNYAHAPENKALALSEDGYVQYRAGEKSQDIARDNALQNCRDRAHKACHIVFEGMTQVGAGGGN